MLLRAVAFLLLFTGAQSTCYYETQTYDPYTWPTVYIINPYNETTSSPEAGTCTLHLYSNNSTLGFGDFTLSDTTSATGWTVTVIDSQGTHKFSGKADPAYNNFLKYVTTSSNITVTLTTDNDSVQFLATMTAKPIGQLIATTAAPVISSTLPYKTVGGVINNPALIAADIAFAIDSFAGAGGFLEQRKRFVSTLLRSLSLTDDPSNTYQSRVAITSLNPMAGSYGPYGPTWAMTSTSQVTTQGLAGVSAFPAQSYWASSLKGIAQHLFSIDKAGSTPSRPHAQRILMIVFSDPPADADVFLLDNFDSLQTAFDATDVVPVFILYGGDTSSNFYTALSKKYVTIPITDTTIDSINTVLANSIDIGTKLCPDPYLSFNPVMLPPTTGPQSLTYNIPSGYTGVKDGNDSPTTWNTDPQKFRYCNFYDATYNFTTMDPYVCFKAFYELEVEKDFLRFYSGTQELVSLSGIDISGSVFAIPRPSSAPDGLYWSALSRFTTNANQVYGGFSFTVYSASDSKCTPPN
ncbi:unnamed protein product [Auanema sp. JU1783]|nr:unnamed protein product [Auanema sp. JU1783]